VPVVTLRNPAITPGRVNPKVRQSTIKKTISKSGWRRGGARAAWQAPAFGSPTQRSV